MIDDPQSRRHDTPREDIFDRARRQPPAAQVGDHRAVEFPGLRHRAPPRLERVERRLADRHQPILVALARAHHHHPDFLVDVAPVEADQLAHAQAGGIKRLDDRAVAQSGRPSVFAIGFDQPAHVVLGQNRRQAALGARRAQRARRARRAYRTCRRCHRFAPAKERLDREQAALDGGATERFHRLGKIAADVVGGDRVGVDFLAAEASAAPRSSRKRRKSHKSRR